LVALFDLNNTLMNTDIFPGGWNLSGHMFLKTAWPGYCKVTRQVFEDVG
jgi:hypothetical protein